MACKVSNSERGGASKGEEDDWGRFRGEEFSNNLDSNSAILACMLWTSGDATTGETVCGNMEGGGTNEDEGGTGVEGATLEEECFGLAGAFGSTALSI